MAVRVQDWIFSVSSCWLSGPLSVPRRFAVIGPARASTIEAALHLAKLPEDVRVEIRSCVIARDFVDGRLDPDSRGYYAHSIGSDVTWSVCIGSVHEVLDR